MRRLNAVLTAAIMVLLLVHIVAGTLQTAGLLPGCSVVMKILAWGMLALIGVHTLIGVKLTADTLRITKKAGVSYPKENRLFWLRRISGLAIMVFIVCHVLIFMGNSRSGAFRLHVFAGAELATQILLVVSIAVHVLSNLKPLFIGLGIRRFRDILPDVLFILSVLLLAAGIGFALYFIRWNAF